MTLPVLYTGRLLLLLLLLQWTVVLWMAVNLFGSVLRSSSVQLRPNSFLWSDHHCLCACVSDCTCDGGGIASSLWFLNLAEKVWSRFALLTKCDCTTLMALFMQCCIAVYCSRDASPPSSAGTWERQTHCSSLDDYRPAISSYLREREGKMLIESPTANYRFDDHFRRRHSHCVYRFRRRKRTGKRGPFFLNCNWYCNVHSGRNHRVNRCSSIRCCHLHSWPLLPLALSNWIGLCPSESALH